MAVQTVGHNATRRVTNALEKMLFFGELGHPLPPERQLAQLLGVSRVTIRRAMDRLEGDGKIRREQGRGTYLCHGPPIVPPAEAFHADAPTIVLLTEQDGEWFNPQFTPWTWRVCLAIQGSASRGTRLCIVNSDRFLAAAPHRFASDAVFRGFIAPTHLWSPAKYEAARELGMPFVGLGRTSHGMYWNIVDLEWDPGLADAIADIAPVPEDRVFIPGDPHPREIDRQVWLEHVFAHLDRCGVPAEAIVVGHWGMFEQDGYLAMRWYLKEFGLPTLVLSDFDLSAAGAYRAIAAHRERASGAGAGRMRFLGSNDMEIGHHLTPALSTLSFDYPRIAETVLAMLRQQRETGRSAGLRYVRATYVRRESAMPRSGRTKGRHRDRGSRRAARVR